MKKLLWLVALVLWTSSAEPQSQFYQGKAITVVAGANAGSVYDLYIRLVTRFMGKYIPGNPNFIVQNMGGAGSIIGANYVYNVVKPDGLTIGAVQPAIYFHQLLMCGARLRYFDFGIPSTFPSVTVRPPTRMA